MFTYVKPGTQRQTMIRFRECPDVEVARQMLQDQLDTPVRVALEAIRA